MSKVQFHRPVSYTHLVAIGGIKESNILSLKGSGICGVAVVSAIYAKEDPQAAAAGLRLSLIHI